jgi:hypothetical protein
MNLQVMRLPQPDDRDGHACRPRRHAPSLSRLSSRAQPGSTDDAFVAAGSSRVDQLGGRRRGRNAGRAWSSILGCALAPGECRFRPVRFV